jgi:hypothetical protein
MVVYFFGSTGPVRVAVKANMQGICHVEVPRVCPALEPETAVIYALRLVES